MTKWVTYVDAINPFTGQLTNFFGPYVPGDTKEQAEDYCQRNGLGYCRVDSQLIAEIPQKEDGSADWDKEQHYDN